MQKDYSEVRASELFEQLKMPCHEHFLPYVEEGLKMYAQRKDYVFDKDRICRLEDTYHIFGDCLDVVLESADIIRKDDAYSRLCYIIISFLKQKGPLQELQLQDKGSLTSEFVGLFAILYFVEEFVEDCEKRGIPQEIMQKTLRGINCIRKNKELTGYPGIGMYLTWLAVYARREIYHINNFSFQFGRKYKDKDVVSVHIPKGTDLSTEKVIRDFAEAEVFFKTYFPEYRFSGFICYSWMMNPELEEIMGRKTKVSQFGDLFERYEIETTGTGVYRFVYNLPNPVPPETLCENTSMQRAIKSYLLKGNIFKEYGGFRAWSEEELADR